MTHARHLAVAVALVAGLGCDRTSRGVRDDLGPRPDPPPPVVLPTEVVYRVTGDIPNVRITYFSSTQGTTQAVSDLPWLLKFTTLERSVFVFLQAEAPIDNFRDGTLVVQIFVDGALFREARGSGFNPSLSVSGEVTR